MHPLPPARIVRQAGLEVAPPRVPLRVRLSPIVEGSRVVVGYLFAFWPLTAIVLVSIAILIATSTHAGP